MSIRMSAKKPLDYYKNISAITSQMLAAAQDQDWDLLADLEKNCAEYVEALKRVEVIKPVGASFINVKVGYIKKILEDDKQIRALVSPWMKKLDGLINYKRVEQKVSQKYSGQ